ncbi:MAG: hypothetical protein R3C17_17965 [Planctomycetaceae bacterium]
MNSSPAAFQHDPGKMTYTRLSRFSGIVSTIKRWSEAVVWLSEQAC